MDSRCLADGAAVTDLPSEKRRWLLVCEGPLAPEERAVLAAVRRRLHVERHELVTVLLGTSSYDAESLTPGAEEPGEEWLLEDDARGRGVRPPAGRPGRTVTAEELVAAIMAAERVVQFP